MRRCEHARCPRARGCSMKILRGTVSTSARLGCDAAIAPASPPRARVALRRPVHDRGRHPRRRAFHRAPGRDRCSPRRRRQRRWPRRWRRSAGTGSRCRAGSRRGRRRSGRLAPSRHRPAGAAAHRCAARRLAAAPWRAPAPASPSWGRHGCASASAAAWTTQIEARPRAASATWARARACRGPWLLLLHCAARHPPKRRCTKSRGRPAQRPCRSPARRARRLRQRWRAAGGSRAASRSSGGWRR
mmetsp:Transcript_42841/g.132339  ORF Transcript_42841/g.132339 Transcript_42841/m.132339 type:complete len:245 (-) Transcript_42841:417-1151(-)